jgi:regulator of protease activity HflC (stomatin/prohibitin superfamily)
VLAAEGRKQAAILDAEGDARAIELRAQADRARLTMIGQGEGDAANARLTGIKAAEADRTVLTVEYLEALSRIGDGRATKLVIPADFAGLLGLVSAITAAGNLDDGTDEVRPKGGLPIPDEAQRVNIPED